MCATSRVGSDGDTREVRSCCVTKEVRTLEDMQRSALLLGLFFVVSTFGCTHTGALREQASQDFNCPVSEVRIASGGSSRHVDVCGKQVVYHWTGQGWVQR